MTTTRQPPQSAAPRQISLRALARELNVHHSSLSAAVRDLRLAKGVHIGKNGRVTVTDADEAKRAWRSIHVPQMAEFRRMEEAERRARKAAREAADAEHAEYVARSVAAVLVALHFLNRSDQKALIADVETRAAMIADLRTRFDYEVAAYMVDDSDQALAYFDDAVENALEWFADQASDEDEPKEAG
jgi:inorganic triphosphatase YgiF